MLSLLRLLCIGCSRLTVDSPAALLTVMFGPFARTHATLGATSAYWHRAACILLTAGWSERISDRAYRRVIRNRPIAEEVNGSTLRSEAVRSALSSEGTATNAALYLLLRAVDRFQEANHRAPGTEPQDCEADVPVLKSLCGSILSESGAQHASSAVSDDLLGELHMDCALSLTRLTCHMESLSA